MAGKKKELQLQAEASHFHTLDAFKGKCEPVFLFYSGGKAVAMVKGVNGPLLQKTILEHVQEAKKQQEMGDKYIEAPGQEISLLESTLEVPPNEDTHGQEDKVEAEQRGLEDKEVVDLSDDSYTVAIIKPDAVSQGKVNEIKNKLQEAGFILVTEEQRHLTEEQARDFYLDQAGQSEFEDLVKFISSGPCHVLVLSRGTEVNKDVPAWKELIEQSDVELMKAPPSEKLKYQESSDSKELASRELAFFFPSFGKEQQKTGTDEAITPKIQNTLALIRPDLLREKKKEILQKIRESGFTIAMQKEIMLTEEQAKGFYREHVGQDYFPVLIKHMTSGPILALALTREDAVQHWRNLLGPKKLEDAKEKAPESLHAEFALENIPINQLHGSSSPEEARKDLEFFFPVEQTLAVIKPDAYKEHKDDILSYIKEAGFSISQMKETVLTKEMAEGFYKDHRGKPFFDQLVQYMCQGPSMMIILSKENAVQEWRDMMGPTDLELAKQSNPSSLRAQFAKSILENAIHGSSNVEHAKKNINLIFENINLE
ncbi:Thioredoxin domain-containing protein 3-like [Acipenser ruthenus]|uniref:Thioredoxin domain-containing protein 3-like n=1 Tax=Acipenser ruthenus TaxID=7906 RepID=A0A662YVA0_ACIRT|nr:Thioredoxin domain-containing protein 3-like [Acipenser ruthenus]